MKFEFKEEIYSEGTRSFIRVPFNVWEETGLKGNIPCRITIGDVSFECKLLPKGSGIYVIPMTKKKLAGLEIGNEYDIEMETIGQLSRINHDSPYSKENPIRKIDSINNIPITQGLCGHTCVAMIAGVTLSDVIALMGKEPASWSKILEALDYYGIRYESKAVYTKGKDYKLPECCILNNDNGFVLSFKGSYYGVDEIDPKKTVSFIEIKC